MREGETPADFHAGCETGGESCDIKSGETQGGLDFRIKQSVGRTEVLAEKE